MKDKTLILTVGLPRSGKSTWANELINVSGNHPIGIVCPDDIRLALHGQAFIASAEPTIWSTAHIMVNALFERYNTVILDACNITTHRRHEWLSKKWTTVYKEFDTTVEECKGRCTLDNIDLIPIIDRMAKVYQPLNVIEKQNAYI